MTVTAIRSPLDEALALAPELSARAQEGEELGTMPLDLVDAAKAAGLFRLALPRSLGGHELAPAEIVPVIEELCRADGSAGWTITIGNGTAFFAWLDPAVAAELLSGDPDVASAGSFGPTGRLVPNGAGYQLDGRWTFGSGSKHASWFFNGAFVFDGEAPRMLPDRGPDWRLVVVPAPAVEVIDNWDVAGLKGTGSHDVAVAGFDTEDAHTIAPFFEPARQDGPLWRFPFFVLIGTLFAGIPLGIARRALDEFAQIAQTKQRIASDKLMSHEDDIQLAYAQAEGPLQAARSFVFDVLGDLWTTACAGDVPSVDQRLRFQLATQEVMRAGIAAVDAAFTMAGAGAVYSHHPLQRCFRDIHTACQHVYWAPAADKRFAKNRFGVEQPPFGF